MSHWFQEEEQAGTQVAQGPAKLHRVSMFLTLRGLPPLGHPLSSLLLPPLLSLQNSAKAHLPTLLQHSLLFQFRLPLVQ